MKYRPKRLRRLDRIWLNDRQPTYFITICTASRRNVLATAVVHTRMRQFLINSASHHDWCATCYVLMPDHLHLLATPGPAAVTLGGWIKSLKACVADREFKWQTGFFDHVLRSDESHSEKWEYIRNNPVRAGFAENADAWPFGGEIVWAQGDVGASSGSDEPGQAGDLHRPPHRETRPTRGQTAHSQPAGDQRDVGPVSRPGAAEDMSSHGRDPAPRHTAAAAAHHVAPAPRREARPTPHAKQPAGWREIVISRVVSRAGASADQVSAADPVATEEPLEIRVEGHSVAVVMRTPGHDRELAAGFLVTENLIRAREDIFDITQCGSSAADHVVNVTLRNPAAFDPAKLTRHVFSSSSCGVCSKATIDAVRQQFPPIQSNCRVGAATVLKLPALLREKQETFDQTGGLHACALFDLRGNLLALREDVGRHNALDKLIGSALLDGSLPLRDRVLLLSGRVSFEMMQKALAAGIPIVAAISAPTTLAVDFARESNQTLIGFVRGETMNIYTGRERLL